VRCATGGKARLTRPGGWRFIRTTVDRAIGWQNPESAAFSAHMPFHAGPVDQFPVDVTGRCGAHCTAKSGLRALHEHDIGFSRKFK